MELLIGIAVMVACAFLFVHLTQKTTEAAQSPTDTTAAYTDTLGQKVSLQGGPWVITFLRQSGNVHRVDTAVTGREAVQKVQTAFRKAKIDLIRLPENGSDGFTAMRAIHNARGSSEGKKLGGAIVARAYVSATHGKMPAALSWSNGSPKPVRNWTQRE